MAAMVMARALAFIVESSCTGASRVESSRVELEASAIQSLACHRCCLACGAGSLAASVARPQLPVDQ